MPLLLAIEPDARQAESLAALVSAHLTADLALARSVADALAALPAQQPDLVLTTSSLSEAEQAALTAGLSARDGQHPGVPMLAIPHLGAAPAPKRRTRGLLARLRRPRARRGSHDGDPAAFAAQITECLAMAEAVRRACAHAAGLGSPGAVPIRPESDLPAAALDIQVIGEPERADESVVDTAWLDLEPLLDDEAKPVARPRARVADGGPEPDVIELPPPDELWAQLAPGYAARMAPLEGPSMTPTAPHARTPEERAAMETTELTEVPLRLVGAPISSDRPKQDEWGLYDPEQCGFAALLMRLDELANDDRREREGGNRSAIMRP